MTPNPPAPQAFSDSARRYTLFILVVAYTSNFVDRSIVSILLEPIKNDLGVSDTALGFLSGFAFAFLYAILGIPVAMWADRSNRRNIIALAITIWSVMTALCGLAQNFWQLALARVGVGIGEAGASPPSHSIIADLYERKKRVSAMAIYSLGIHFGIMLGFFIGGWVVEWWGWRAAFFIVGLPGLVIAALVRFTLREPPRGMADGTPHEPTKLDLAEGFGQLWRIRSMRHAVIGGTLVAFIGYGGVAWGPAFLMRTHGMTPGEIGSILAPLGGTMGALGAYLSGKMADRMGQRDPRWVAWIVTVCKLLALPLVVVFYLTDSLVVALIVYGPMIALSATYQGSTFAMVQTLSPLHMRAQASAIMLFVLNIIGLGAGPWVVGALSDLLHPMVGIDSLRYALVGISMLGAWGAFHYYLAGRYYPDDLAKADLAVADLAAAAPSPAQPG